MALYDALVHSISSPAIIAIVCTLLIIYYVQKYRNLPPGPWGIPIFGYYPFLKSDTLHLQLQEMRDKYGDIFSMSIAGKLCIFLSSSKVLKEAHVTKADYFASRNRDFSFLMLTLEDGLGITNGESWKVQRKFFGQKFKEYGMLAVKENFCSTIYDSLNEVVNDIRNQEGKPILLTDFLKFKCSCIIRRILFNDQGITEEELKELSTDYDNVLVFQKPLNLMLSGNIARYLIFPFLPNYSTVIRSHNHIVAVLDGVIKRHKAAFDNTQEMDLIDSWYKEKREREIKGDPTAKYFTDLALLSSIYQFLTDGILSLAFFIVFFLQTLVDHPEEQEKIYQELIEVVGPERQPTIEDRSKLPYTNAFMNEALRYSNFIQAFPGLECTKETTINGYRIPVGATTILNTAAVHHSPTVYKDPHKFDTSRYLATPGKQKAELPVMFGVGKRACIAEAFVMTQTFLFVTTIVKTFKLSGAIDATNLSVFDSGLIKIYANSRNHDTRAKHE